MMQGRVILPVSNRRHSRCVFYPSRPAWWIHPVQNEIRRVVIVDIVVASLTSLHCRCPLAASVNRSVQRMREQLATNQAEDRIVKHRVVVVVVEGGEQSDYLEPGLMIVS